MTFENERKEKEAGDNIEGTRRLVSERSKCSRFVEFGELKKTGSFFPCNDLKGCSLPL